MLLNTNILIFYIRSYHKIPNYENLVFSIIEGLNDETESVNTQYTDCLAN